MNTDYWRVDYEVNGRSAPATVDVYAFVKSFTKVFTIDLVFYPKKPNNIKVTNGSCIRFKYNNPDKMPEICDMVKDIDFVFLYVDWDDIQSDKTELYKKATIIHPYWEGDFPKRDNKISNYASKCLSYSGNTSAYKPGMDLSQVKNIEFASDSLKHISDIIENYHFNYVEVSDVDDAKDLEKINTEVLRITSIEADSNFLHNWYQSLAKVKYFIMNTDSYIDDVPPNFTSDRLLAYDISYGNNVRMTWDVLDKICESNQPRFGKTKSARS